MQRVIRECLADPQVAGMTASSYTATNSAIKSYFAAPDIPLDLRKTRKRRAEHRPRDSSIMTLEDFYKMLQKGNPGITMRTIMLIKLHNLYTLQVYIHTNVYTYKFV